MQIALILSFMSIATAILLTRAVLRMERFRLDMLDKYSQKYSDAMHNILSIDVEFGDGMLKDIERWNGIATKKEFLIPVMVALHQLRRRNKSNYRPPNDKHEEEVFARHPDLEVEFIKMKFAALLTACLSSSFMWPSMLNNYIRYMESHPQEKQKFLEIGQKRIGVSEPNTLSPIG